MASGVNNQYWNGVDYDPDQIRPGQPRHEDKEDGAMLFQLHLVYRCQRDRISYQFPTAILNTSIIRIVQFKNVEKLYKNWSVEKETSIELTIVNSKDLATFENIILLSR